MTSSLDQARAESLAEQQRREREALEAQQKAEELKLGPQRGHGGFHSHGGTPKSFILIGLSFVSFAKHPAIQLPTSMETSTWED